MIYIDKPHFQNLDAYKKSISQMTEYLMNLRGIIAVYQIGGLSAPGISDIDIVAIFEDDIICHDTPLTHLTYPANYLFTHNVFGASLNLFKQSFEYVFFHNYKYLAGEDIWSSVIDKNVTSHENVTAMKQQSAKEYLVRMYINMMVERHFNICKIRNLLLNAKALLYDLEFLGLANTPLHPFLADIFKWRKIWFSNPPSEAEINVWYREFWSLYQEFLNDLLMNEPLIVPVVKNWSMTKNIQLKPSDSVSVQHKGTKLPAVKIMQYSDKLCRKYIGLQHRLNDFTITLPMTSTNVPEHINNSFCYSNKAREYNQKFLPSFLPLTTSLGLTDTKL